MRRLAPLKFLFIPVLALFLGGCASLPDTQPFTDATIGLRSAVASSGAAVVGEIDRAQTKGMKSEARKLETAWEQNNKLLSSLVDYANSLQAIVDSGKSGTETVNALAASIGKLAKAANIVEPGAGELGSLVTETAVYVYSYIAKARAAASLEKALAEVQPAIERIAQVMAGEMQQLDDLVRIASKIQRDEIRISNEGRLGYQTSLVNARERLMNQARTALDSGKNSSELGQPEELKRLDLLLAATDSWYKPIEDQLQAITERERLSRRLIAETKSALLNWGAGHAQLLTAIRTKRIPSAAELTQATERIRDLVARFEKL